MEGFLLKKARGESKFFGRKNWKKRWCILDGQYLSYYEDFDRDANKPVNKKGTAAVRGCEVSIVNHQDKKFCFVVKHEHRTPLFLCAETEKIMFVWMKALENAAKGITGGPVNVDFGEYYEALNLDKNQPYTSSQLNKAYRRAALKNHPDKGGSVDAFKKVQEAFEILQSKLEEEEQAKYYENVEFVAEIVKGAAGVGFGMVVVEDTKKGAIVAKEILPVMILRNISPESGGELKKGDRIVKIDDDDITTWTLARVVQRLNDFRVPVNTSVKFTFSRRVRVDGQQEEHEQEPEPMSSPEPATNPPPAPSPQSHNQSADEEDIGEDMFKRRDSLEYRNSGFRDTNTDSLDKDEEEPPVSSSDGKPPRPPAQPRRSDWGQDPVVQCVSLQAENDELSAELERMREELQVVTQERDQLRTEAADLRVQLDTVNGEKKEFLRQLGEAEADCQELERREKDALDLLEQLSEHAQLTPEQTAQIESKVLAAARVVQSGQILESDLSGPNSGRSAPALARRGTVEHAQIAAFSAASYVDSSGRFSEKYDKSDTGKSFLKRLEESVMRQYGNSSAYDPNNSDNDSDVDNTFVGDNLPRRHAHGPPNSSMENNPLHAPRSPRGTELYRTQKQRLNRVPSNQRPLTLISRQSTVNSGGTKRSPPQRAPPRPNASSSVPQGVRTTKPPGQQRTSHREGLDYNGIHAPHSPIKTPQDGFRFPGQHSPTSGPYEYNADYRRTESAGTRTNSAQDKRLRMLSQPTASSRARFESETSPGTANALSAARAARKTESSGMNFSRKR